MLSFLSVALLGSTRQRNDGGGDQHCERNVPGGQEQHTQHQGDDNERGYHSTLSSTFRTDDAYHFPPQGAAKPRALRAFAIWCNEEAPARRISRITGNTLAAFWSASTLIDATALLRAFAS
jgi:hypothetical protein